MNIVIGKQVPNEAGKIKPEITDARNEGFDFIVSPINDNPNKFDPIADIALPIKLWNHRVFIDLGDVGIEDYNPEASIFFRKLLTYALYLPSPAILIDCPRTRTGCRHLATIVNQVLKESRNAMMPQPLVLFRINVGDSDVIGSRQSNGSDGDTDNEPWGLWHTLISRLSIDKRIGIALTFDGDLPDLGRRNRWLGEPIKLLLLSSEIFQTDKSGRPTLASSYESYIYELVKSQSYKLSMVVNGRRNENWQHFGDYMNHLRKSMENGCNDLHFDKGDILQAPLQPLAKDLESMTYDVFEQDSTKYEQYESAIHQALIDLKEDFHRKSKSANPSIQESLQETKKFRPVLVVVGAGRGPLVRRAFKAAARCDCIINLYIVEKNPNSILTLQYMVATLMKEYPINKKVGVSHQVEIFNTDMRGWNPGGGLKADIVISELLGSFSDNELSPECLEGLWKVTRPDTISIPSSYSSYICPIMYRSVHRHLPEQHFESLFVSKLANHYRIDKPQELFCFTHDDMTLDPALLNHSRYKSIRFKACIDTVCHGFGGYFDTILYKDVKLSIVPGQETPGLISWFPAYIPISKPILMLAGQEIEAEFWRCTSTARVWYEWAVSTGLNESVTHSLDSSRTFSRAMSKLLEL